MRSKSQAKRLSFIAVGVLSLLVATGCASTETAEPEDQAFETIKPGVLTVAVLNGNLPRSSIEGDKVTGSWGWLITKFADEHNLELETFATDIKGGVLAVQNKRADIGAVAYYTDERAKVVNFTMQDTYDSAFVAVPKDFKYTGPASIANMAIGVPSSYAQVPYLEKFFPNLQFLESPASGVQAIKNKQLEGFFGTNALLQLVPADDPDIKLVAVKDGDFGLPSNLVRVAEGSFVQCGNDEILDAYNKFFQQAGESKEYEDAWVAAWKKTSAPADAILQNMVKEYKPMNDQCGS